MEKTTVKAKFEQAMPKVVKGLKITAGVVVSGLVVGYLYSRMSDDYEGYPEVKADSLDAEVVAEQELEAE